LECDKRKTKSSSLGESDLSNEDTERIQKGGRSSSRPRDLPFCVFNYVSPIMSLVWGITGMKIESFKTAEPEPQPIRRTAA
jgi:hypothetical protein